MTTIAARRLKTKKDGSERGIKFACDDQVTAGSQKFGIEEKVFSKGPVTFGFAGSVRDLNLLQHALKIPKFSRNDADNVDSWVVRKLIPAMRRTLEDHGSLETSNGYATSDSHLIIAVGGICGYLGHNFSFCGTEEEFWSVGSGSEYALGAMTFGASPAEAVIVAGLHDTGTGAIEREVKVLW